MSKTLKLLTCFRRPDPAEAEDGIDPDQPIDHELLDDISSDPGAHAYRARSGDGAWLDAASDAIVDLSGRGFAIAGQAGASAAPTPGTTPDRQADCTYMAELIKLVAGLSEASAWVAEMQSMLDNIAFQTHLLALNANIEAARAGQRERPLAWVAGEVRTMAQRGAASARAIAAMIVDAVHHLDRGEAQAQVIIEAMRALAESVQTVDALMARLSEMRKARNKNAQP